ncbi:MAG: diguanylate cyclase [Candidatus Krumholzibacteriota bacterium]|nr:diguanylate cyclase [Candidatus Krumholzibacteriota bacterium]
MVSYIARRLVGIVPVLLVVSVACFALLHAIPGGPESVYAENPRVRPDDVARIRANFGLDRPLPIQYASWLKRVVLHGDFGVSYTTGEPVSEMIAERLPATLELMGSAFAAALAIGLVIGVFTGLKRGTPAESLVTAGSLVVVSTPLFWLGIVAVMLFSVHWRIFAPGGSGTLGEPFSLVDHLRHLALPTMVLALFFAATWGRFLRETLDEVLDEDYITVARAKGLRESAVVLRHGVRNALVPVVTVVTMSIPVMFTGSVVVESVFAWPGMGRLFYEGLVRHDYTRVMGIVLVSALLVSVFNLVADCLHGILDPRARSAAEA